MTTWIPARCSARWSSGCDAAERAHLPAEPPAVERVQGPERKVDQARYRRVGQRVRQQYRQQADADVDEISGEIQSRQQDFLRVEAELLAPAQRVPVQHSVQAPHPREPQAVDEIQHVALRGALDL